MQSPAPRQTLVKINGVSQDHTGLLSSALYASVTWGIT